jgi:hypothetical protein
LRSATRKVCFDKPLLRFAHFRQVAPFFAVGEEGRGNFASKTFSFLCALLKPRFYKKNYFFFEVQ